MGSVDWCCFPRFDCDACFAALLGDREHGRSVLAPVANATPKRHYDPGSLVLTTEWECRDGTIRVTNFMPPLRGAPTIVRIVEGIAGSVTVHSELVTRFGYGGQHLLVIETAGAFDPRKIKGRDQDLQNPSTPTSSVSALRRRRVSVRPLISGRRRPQIRTRMRCSSLRPSRVATTTIALGPARATEAVVPRTALNPLQRVCIHARPRLAN
jgi:hypothetical protein